MGRIGTYNNLQKPTKTLESLKTSITIKIIKPLLCKVACPLCQIASCQESAAVVPVVQGLTLAPVSSCVGGFYLILGEVAVALVVVLEVAREHHAALVEESE